MKNDENKTLTMATGREECYKYMLNLVSILLGVLFVITVILGGRYVRLEAENAVLNETINNQSEQISNYERVVVLNRKVSDYWMNRSNVFELRFHNAQRKISELNDTINELSFVHDSCAMKYGAQAENGIYGYYQPYDYFCVWVNGRTKSEIADATFHELAHYYQYDNPEHFKVLR